MFGISNDCNVCVAFYASLVSEYSLLNMNRVETEIILCTCSINIRGFNTAPSFDHVHGLCLDYKLYSVHDSSDKYRPLLLLFYFMRPQFRM